MATSDQVKALLRSHFSDDAERFYTVALQVAAHEARKGNKNLAVEIRNILDKERSKRKTEGVFNHQILNLDGLVISDTPKIPKSSLVVSQNLNAKIQRIIHEYRQRSRLKQHGLTHRRKILLVGEPGTGKTMTAKVLATELGLSLNTIQIDRLVTKFMGETSAKLRQIFDLIERVNGVYLFDEFDAIGGERSLNNDVGEMRRVLNSLLQFIEQDDSDSFIIATTNNPKLLDNALFRRFDDVLGYQAPEETERKHLIQNILGLFLATRFSWKSVLLVSEGLSQSEIDLACRDAMKTAILNNKEKISAKKLSETLEDRQNVYKNFSNNER